MARSRNRVCRIPGCPNIQPDRSAPRHHRNGTDTRGQQHQRRSPATGQSRSDAKQLSMFTGHGMETVPRHRPATHEATDLTANHVTPIARGGDPRGPSRSSAGPATPARPTDSEGTLIQTGVRIWTPVQPPQGDDPQRAQTIRRGGGRKSAQMVQTFPEGAMPAVPDCGAMPLKDGDHDGSWWRSE